MAHYQCNLKGRDSFSQERVWHESPQQALLEPPEPQLQQQASNCPNDHQILQNSQEHPCSSSTMLVWLHSYCKQYRWTWLSSCQHSTLVHATQHSLLPGTFCELEAFGEILCLSVSNISIGMIMEDGRLVEHIISADPAAACKMQRKQNERCLITLDISRWQFWPCRALWGLGLFCQCSRRGGLAFRILTNNILLILRISVSFQPAQICTRLEPQSRRKG